MTELTEPEDSAAAQPSREWPAAERAGLSAGAGVTDQVVAEAIKRLEAVPHLPVADQEAAYNELHDDLLAALNADPADPADSTGPAGTVADGGA
ncbi:hypothetical protein ACFWIX_15290 [Pseudarthrobacter sp. NPDC058362]|uniref:hypothetical protein n=1 Tax=unclassified Pseudarthrobacter TaxID=2647000 RepID=UPI0036478FAD